MLNKYQRERRREGRRGGEDGNRYGEITNGVNEQIEHTCKNQRDVFH